MILLMAVPSCRRQKESPEELLEVKQYPVEFTVSLDAYSTKATETAFTSGDVFGIFAPDPIDEYYFNVRSVLRDGKVDHGKKIRWILVETTDFYAYYPYDAGFDDGRHTFSVKADQRNAADYAASDFCVAMVTAEYGEVVNLPFRHALSRLRVITKTEDPTDEVVSAAIGPLALSVDVDIEKSSLTLGSATGKIQAGKTAGSGPQATFAAILVPQTERLTLNLTTRKGKTLTTSLERPETLECGYSYDTSTIIIPSDGSLDNVNFSITVSDWGDNGELSFNKQ